MSHWDGSAGGVHNCSMWEFVESTVIPDNHVCSKCRHLEELQLRVFELESEVQTLWGHQGWGELPEHFDPGDSHTS